MATAASTTAFDLWRVIVAGYASSYLRRDANDMPCGFHYVSIDKDNHPAPADRGHARRVVGGWLGHSAGQRHRAARRHGRLGRSHPGRARSACARCGPATDAEAAALRAGVAATEVTLPRADLPMWVLHGASDGLLPTAFSSEPYVAWLRAEGRQPLYWRVPYAQHFDAFLPVPGFGAAHVPLMPYGYAALDRHVGAPVRGRAAGRGAADAATRGRVAIGALTREALDLP